MTKMARNKYTCLCLFKNEEMVAKLFVQLLCPEKNAWLNVYTRDSNGYIFRFILKI